ncbi:MAG: Hsp70 family protein [Ruminiclostridium sp.]|nr:Hsp70 family protein [Ruminiclostridium sp.]
MINLGIDFGSTYTLASVYNEATDNLEAVSPDQTANNFPSIVAYSEKKDKFEFGEASKLRIGKPGYRIFKNFKMLIGEKDKALCKERGYDDSFPAERIAGIFLKHIMEKAVSRCQSDGIDNLVICVPEIWNDNLRRVDSKNILRNICEETGLARSVTVVSEPAAASAYFAYDYQCSMKTDFNGNILMIDYGGGTLDLTLTNVSGHGSGVEIKVLERCGAGENEEKQIGKASVVYMESVVRRSIIAAGLEEEGFEPDDGFFLAVFQFERFLTSEAERVTDTFIEFESTPEDLDDEEFTEIEYKDDYVTVTFGTMLRVYNELIAPVLSSNLDHMCRYMTDKGYPFMSNAVDNFKIVLVGGFGNYYLVKKQIDERFRISSKDKRSFTQDQGEREKAIAFGAALLANKRIRIRSTAPYSIGLLTRDVNGKVQYLYAIRYKQDIEPDTIYYQNKPDGKKAIILTAGGGFREFIINFGDNDSTALTLTPNSELVRRLQNVVTNQYKTATVGFSLDTSGVLSLHVGDYDMITRAEGEPKQIKLKALKDMFDTIVL